MTQLGRGSILSTIFAAGIVTLSAMPARAQAQAQESTARFLNALAAEKRQVIVTYGTSLTANSAWPEQFRNILQQHYGQKARVINSASGGKDSRWGLANVHKRVVAKHPDAVFLEFAINDALMSSELSLDESAWNHDRMIEAIRAEAPNCEIFLLVMNPPTGEQFEKRAGIASYEEVTRRAALKWGTGLIDFSPTWSSIIHDQPGRWSAYAPDGLHPSAVASREVIVPCLLESLVAPFTPSRRRPFNSYGIPR